MFNASDVLNCAHCRNHDSKASCIYSVFGSMPGTQSGKTKPSQAKAIKEYAEALIQGMHIQVCISMNIRSVLNYGI